MKGSLPKLKEKARQILNAWIRQRDLDEGCISCGGQVQHAGHYFSAGHHSHLRFEPTNIHGQCVKCNRYLHGNLINYRKGLIKRYGIQFVEDLEALGDKREVKKWTREELEEIINQYK